MRMGIHERRSESSLFGPKLKQIGRLRTHMAEGLILPEANQILILTADGLQWANYPIVSYGTRKTADWSASTEVFAFLCLVNVYSQNPKIYI